jgi:hypothetical protein
MKIGDIFHTNEHILLVGLLLDGDRTSIHKDPAFEEMFLRWVSAAGAVFCLKWLNPAVIRRLCCQSLVEGRSTFSIQKVHTAPQKLALDHFALKC